MHLVTHLTLQNAGRGLPAMTWALAWSGLLWCCALAVAADPLWILWHRTTRTTRDAVESGVPEPVWQSLGMERHQRTKATCKELIDTILQPDRELAQPNCAATTDGVICTVEEPTAVVVTEYKCLPDTKTP
jgi:hypothetical protein